MIVQGQMQVLPRGECACAYLLGLLLGKGVPGRALLEFDGVYGRRRDLGSGFLLGQTAIYILLQHDLDRYQAE